MVVVVDVMTIESRVSGIGGGWYSVLEGVVQKGVE